MDYCCLKLVYYKCVKFMHSYLLLLCKLLTLLVALTISNQNLINETVVKSCYYYGYDFRIK